MDTEMGGASIEEIGGAEQQPILRPQDHDGSHRYEVDGVGVDVRWSAFGPKEKGPRNGNSAVIFFPGWSMSEKAASTEELGQALSERSGGLTLSIDTRAERPIDDSLWIEAQAVEQMVAGLDQKELTIVAHSQGGIEATNLVAILQKSHPEIKISGLVLINTVGLYDQRRMDLIGRFAKDLLINTPRTLFNKLKARRELRQGAEATVDVTAGIAREVRDSKNIYPHKFLNQVSEMSRKNPRLEQVACPVVLIQGKFDPVSADEQILPTEFRTTQDGETASRERYLKENLFPNSPYVRMMIPERFGDHGLPMFRPEAVAKSALYLLDRFHREELELSPVPVRY